jgi:hypothetical protein
MLIATVAFFALWVVALKPSSGTGGTSASQNSVGAYHNDITAAKHAAKVVAGNTARQSAAESGSQASAPAASTAKTPAKAQASSAKPASKPVAHPRHAVRAHHKTAAQHKTAAHAIANPGVASTPSARLGVVQRALAGGKVLALLFYNRAAPDDDAVKQELSTISTHHGRVVKLAIPLGEIPSYAQLTAQLPVNFSPTLVIVDRHRQAVEITGFADTFAIAQQIDRAL